MIPNPDLNDHVQQAARVACRRRSSPDYAPDGTITSTDDTMIDDGVIADHWPSIALAVYLLIVAAVVAGSFPVRTRLKPSPPVPRNVPNGARSKCLRSEIPTVFPEFTFDITDEAGIDFVHENGAYGDKLLPETMGGGCAFFDVDGDGDQDLLLVNSRAGTGTRVPSPQQPAHAWPCTTNDGQGPLRRCHRRNGRLDVSLYGMGAAVGDFDNDGHPDLFISAVGHNRLFRNTGDRFEDVTDGRGRRQGRLGQWSSSCGFFDADADGDLDLFVCNYVGWSKDFDLARTSRSTAKLRAYGQPQKFPAAHPYLYLNNGERTTFQRRHRASRGSRSRN